MAISQGRYVKIASGVAGEAAVGNRELILRVMTTSALVPTTSVLEFTTLEDVGNYFGTTNSAEYYYAAKYFAFTSKDITKPEKISFARYADAAADAIIIGNGVKPNLAAIKAITTPSITIGDTTGTPTLSGATSLADVATALNAVEAFTAMTFAYNTTYNCFTLSFDGAETETVAEGALAVALGLAPSTHPVNENAISEADTPVQAIARATGISDNFGSFIFIPSLSVSQIVSVADWNNADEQNCKFMYLVAVAGGNAETIASAVKGYNGVWLQLSPANAEEDYMPAAILAATDFSRTNGTQSYMFQSFAGVAPIVESNADADIYDALRVNYYGATQKSGKKLAFLQRGYLQGDIVDAGVYTNEIWLKDSFTTSFFNLLMAVNRIPANSDGEDMCRTVMQPTLDTAKLNGTIMPAKPFTPEQKAEINQLLGRSSGADEVYADGYAVKVAVETYTDPSGVAAYRVNYLLVYSKGDSVRMVKGTDVLI